MYGQVLLQKDKVYKLIKSTGSLTAGAWKDMKNEPFTMDNVYTRVPGFVPEVYEVWKCDDNTILYSMERVQGMTLSEMARKQIPVDETKLSEGFRKFLANVFDMFKLANVIHRDMHGDNIIIDDKTGNWKLIDFGLVLSDIPYNRPDRPKAFKRSLNLLCSHLAFVGETLFESPYEKWASTTAVRVGTEEIRSLLANLDLLENGEKVEEYFTATGGQEAKDEMKIKRSIKHLVGAGYSVLALNSLRAGGEKRADAIRQAGAGALARSAVKAAMQYGEIRKDPSLLLREGAIGAVNSLAVKSIGSDPSNVFQTMSELYLLLMTTGFVTGLVSGRDNGASIGAEIGTWMAVESAAYATVSANAANLLKASPKVAASRRRKTMKRLT